MSLLELPLKIPQTGHLKQQKGLFSQPWRLRNLKSSHQHIWFPLRTVCFSCTQTPSHRVLSCSFLCGCTSLVSVFVSKSPLLRKTPVSLGESPPIWPLFNLITPLRTLPAHAVTDFNIGILGDTIHPIAAGEEAMADATV